MSYLALARKWRPRTFSQLVGQEHINKALINALNQQRVHHAYLFTGTRGVGKTSVARILAKALNCEQGITSEPCLQCDFCIAIEQGRLIDLIEIDGASKTRVEDTRELLDNVHYAPTSGRFKIYLIDEVHMLSQHSFNALLKTLEEPPAHVKFILATTDPQKLPVTVLSRCLQFHLRHLTPQLISQQLQVILKNESIDFELKALDILARAARGSMRDALSLLDQAITSCDTIIQSGDVKMLLGYTQQDYAVQLLHALAEQNPAQILSLNQQIATEGGHFHYVLDELLTCLHQITVYQSIGDHNPLISPSSEVKILAKQFSPEDTQLFYQIALKGREEIHLAPTLTIGFNMTLLRMLTFRPSPGASAPSLAFQKNNVTHSPVIKEPLPQETKVENTSSNSLSTQCVPAALTTANSEIHAPSATEASIPAATESLISNTDILNKTEDWNTIVPQLKLTGLALNAIDNTEFVCREGREITLRIATGHQSLFTPTTITRIEAALTRYYQSPISIILSGHESVQASPALQKERTTQKQQQKAELALQEDPVFQQLQQEFSAELVKNSIVLIKNDV